MRAKLYEKYYKLGFTQDMCKSLHLKKPKKDVKRFYYVLMAVVFAIGMISEL